MNCSTVSTAPSGNRVKDMEPAASFTARRASARAIRVYRVYLRRDDLFFIVLADDLSARPETLTAHFGLLGLLIGAMMKKRAKKKNAAATQRMDQTAPEQLLTEHKHNFKLHTSEIREGSIEPPPWITLETSQAGHWKLLLRDDRKLKFQFENNEEMTAALDALSKLFNGGLKVNVEWDEKKKRFKKKKS
ncbi:MAG TPA: hypothetical protein VN578_01990 [Candidatus Binatia bacterium]|jgi:hypothetical protein|nr:hypothetical protein [Candidatus Binatia bacterium]